MAKKTIAPSVMEKLFMDGMAVHLGNHKWSGTLKLEPQDLGFTEDEWPDIYNLGSMYIYPKARINVINSIGQACYHHLKKMSYPFPIGSGIQFVPKKRLEIFKKRYFEHYLPQREAQIDLLEKEYDEMRDKHITALEKVAHLAYSKMNGNANVSEQRFVERFMDRVYAAYPDKSELRERFAMPFNEFSIAAPNAELKDKLNAEMDKFVSEVISTFRADVVQVCKHVQGAMQKKEIIRKDTFDSLKNSFAELRQMNFFGDATAEELMKEIEKKFLNEDHEKVQGNVKEELNKALGGIVNKIENTNDKNVMKIANAYKKRNIKL